MWKDVEHRAARQEENHRDDSLSSEGGYAEDLCD